MNDSCDETIEFVHVDKPIKHESQIVQFYHDKTFFVTGSTGYLGKCYVEKLLRACPGIRRIYLLVRPKRDLTIQDRMNEYFTHIIFDSLREKYPEFMKKITPLAGDLMKPGLGLSTEDKQLLIEETDLIIHHGATVIFDMQISIALKINVLGTKEMLDLATECKRLKTFVYVSTAFSHCYMKEIEEKFYDPPADLKMIQDMLKADQENATGLSDAALEGVISPWPNTYTFTKATAESIVQQYSRRVSFSCCVFRPSIVSSTYKEPLKSWCGNANGQQLLFLAAGLGLGHTMWLLDYPTDIVPADMTTNALLAVTWDVTRNKKNLKEAQIYTYASSIANPITFRTMEPLITGPGFDCPPVNAFWYYFIVQTECYYAFWIYHIILHFFPACLADIYFTATLQGPKALPIFFKVTKHLDKMFYFANGNWRHPVTEMTKVWEKMNDKDNEIFYCDIRSLDWRDYFKTYWLGIRMYLLNDPVDTIEYAKRRYAKLKIIHYTICIIAILLFGLCFLYSIDKIINWLCA